MNKKILIFTFGTKNLDYQYKLTNANKSAYANKYNYDYKFFEIDSIEKNKNPKHLKIEYLLEFIGQTEYDYIMFMDSDTWFNNFDQSIDNIIDNNCDAILICANDQGYKKYEEKETPRDDFRKLINSGVLLFKKCDDSLKLVQLWNNYINDEDLNKRFGKNLFNGMYDQPRLSALLLFNFNFRNKTKILPAKFFNCLPQCGKPNDSNTFIFHAAGINYQQNRNELFKQKFIQYTNINNELIK